MANNNQKTDQVGAQDQGVAIKGNNNKLIGAGTMTNDVSGVGGNVTITNTRGVSESTLESIIGNITRPSFAEIQAAKKPDVTAPRETPGAPPLDDGSGSKKKFLVIGALVAVVIVIVLFIKRKS